jgi:hypothetical protein
MEPFKKLVFIFPRETSLPVSTDNLFEIIDFAMGSKKNLRKMSTAKINIDKYIRNFFILMISIRILNRQMLLKL